MGEYGTHATRYICINEKEVIMKAGDKIPESLGFDANGREVKASDFAGKRLAIYFYPKDNTPGCTAEACSLRDGYAQLKAAGYEIVGVSRDSAASHARFAERHELPFTLIADTDLKLNEAFGVWRKRRWPAGNTWGRCEPRLSSMKTALLPM